MAIRDWPASERPREKLLQKGSTALSDAELLAIFLRTGSCGLSAVDLARMLLNRFGNIGSLLAADQEAFCSSPGLGPAKYTQLQAVMELARRHMSERLQRDTVFNHPQAVAEFLLAKLGSCKREVFGVLFLDSQHRLVCWEELFFGTIDTASVHPREVVVRALYHNAAAVIFAHNHPSGVAEPSQADQQITQQLQKALGLLDIRVLDHLVVGGGFTVSLAQRGMLL
ncbi:MAG: DNA repair protein RadC [Pseudomonadales bacterium]|nr:DNA repair protein RadC [Pseudomonadales bacterium]MCP5172860.1 DNA repair protein RadC [Pseudomonadales bacterium]MCP5302334.1 DNA repair protein RadC [Pseudomonadales bacterium]